jgi:hypothetical protein
MLQEPLHAQAQPARRASELEHCRLEHRARRLDLVIAALRERVSATAQTGDTPAALQQALSGFSSELAHVRRRLHEPRSAEHARR